MASKQREERCEICGHGGHNDMVSIISLCFQCRIVPPAPARSSSEQSVQNPSTDAAQPPTLAAAGALRELQKASQTLSSSRPLRRLKRLHAAALCKLTP